MDITYQLVPKKLINEDVISETAKLFSENYGVWGNEVKEPLIVGNNVKLSPNRLKEQYLFNDNCGVSLAILDGNIVGQCFFTSFVIKEIGNIVIITQLVVHPDYRGDKIGQKLIHLCLDTEWKICGLITSHPYAVRGLEKATGLKCDPILIKAYAGFVITNSNIPYLQNCILDCTVNKSIINTNFFVDHTEINELLTYENNWKLGSINEGEEFLALVVRI